MRAEDIALLVILLVIWPPLTWFSYQMIRRPTRFPHDLWRLVDRLFCKITPGFDDEMVMKAYPLPWAKSVAKYHYEGTTGSPERDAKLRRFDRIWFRAFGILLAFFSVVILVTIVAIATGNAHAQ